MCVRTLALYETRPAARLPPEAGEALRGGGIAAVLLHSPKAARVLAALSDTLAGAGLGRLRVLGLSAACLAPVAHLPFAGLAAAVEPNESSLLELL